MPEVSTALVPRAKGSLDMTVFSLSPAGKKMVTAGEMKSFSEQDSPFQGGSYTRNSYRHTCGTPPYICEECLSRQKFSTFKRPGAGKPTDVMLSMLIIVGLLAVVITTMAFVARQSIFASESVNGSFWGNREAMVTANATACGESGALRDPAAALAQYYGAINRDRFCDAYSVQSSRVKSRLCYDDFLAMWRPNRALKLDEVQVISRNSGKALIMVKLVADDPDESGKMVRTSWRGLVREVYENSQWCYDGGDFVRE